MVARTEGGSRHLVTRQVAADQYGISTRTLDRRIADGTIRAYQMEGVVRVDLDEVDAAFKPVPVTGDSDVA